MNKKQKEWLIYAAKHGLVEASVCADIVAGNKWLLPKENNPTPEEETQRANKGQSSGVLAWNVSVKVNYSGLDVSQCVCCECEDCQAVFHELLFRCY